MTISRQCVILVGGLGTRLGEMTRECPKPLLEVGGKPFIGHLIDQARRFGFDDFILLAGYRHDLVKAYAACEAGVRVVVEPELSGTAGALTYARALLNSEFLMLNGDSLFDFNWLDLAVQENKVAVTARLALRQVDDAGRYGAVELTGEKITSFREKSHGQGPGLINGGVYWLNRQILDYISGCPASLEHDVFPVLAERGELAGCEYRGGFIDIGVPEDLAIARSDWRSLRRAPAVFFDRDGVLNHDDGYTHRIDAFRWMEGARVAIRRCNDEGKFVFVVTNQAGVARGFYDEGAVKQLHQWMNDDLRNIGAHIDDFRFCPHHPDGAVSKYSRACDCRKPQPGMILSLLDSWPVDEVRSIMVGDKPSDIMAAEAAGIRGLTFRSSFEHLFSQH